MKELRRTLGQRGLSTVEVLLLVLGIALLVASIILNVILLNRVSYIEGQVQTYGQVQRMDSSGQDLSQWLLDVQEWMVAVHTTIDLSDHGWLPPDGDPGDPPPPPPPWGVD